MSAIAAIISSHWLILPEALQRMAAIAERDFDHESLAARQGVPLDNTRTSEKRGSVAVIPVTGPIFRYANLFTAISGATSTQVLATDFQAALDDPAIKAIVLDINSPGGQADGVNELAQLIYASRARKPITAYIGGTGASAAYWIASAANRIVVDPTALVGSIGVVSSVVDSSGADARAGRKTYEIVSQVSPRKRPDVSTDEGRAQYQEIVDRLAQVFVNAVARNRGTTAANVVDNYGAGGILVGQDAVKAGMADALGSLESTINNAQTGVVRTSTQASILPTAPLAQRTNPDMNSQSPTKEQIAAGWAQAVARATGERLNSSAPIGGGWDRVVAKYRSNVEPQFRHLKRAENE